MTTHRIEYLALVGGPADGLQLPVIKPGGAFAASVTDEFGTLHHYTWWDDDGMPQGPNTHIHNRCLPDGWFVGRSRIGGMSLHVDLRDPQYDETIYAGDVGGCQ